MELFELLESGTQKYCNPPTILTGARSLTYRDSLTMFLIFFHSGMSFTGLGLLFRVTRQTISEHVLAWSSILGFFADLTTSRPTLLETQHMTGEQDAATLRIPSLSARYIIDATNVEADARRSAPGRKGAMYSSYVACHTYKFLVAVALSGHVVFVSDAYGGSVSDVDITEKCGFLNILEDGERVLADRGFKLTETMAKRNITFVEPPNNREGEQFEEHALEHGRRVSKIRIRVERAIGALKGHGVFSTRVRHSAEKLVSNLFKFGAWLVNFSSRPYVKVPHPHTCLASWLQATRSKLNAMKK
jgi:hypothetical protein